MQLSAPILASSADRLGRSLPARAALVLALLATSALGCGAAADLGVRLREPAPAAPVDLAWEQLSFTGHGGTQLFAQSWRPASARPRGVLVIHHGLADHSTRYAPLAEELARAGYAVWAFDMRGHGRSAGRRALMNNMDEMLGDLDAFVRLVRERADGAPLFLMGHSIGGLITALYAIERQPQLAGYITVSPGIAVDAPPLQAAAIQFVNAIAPNANIFATPHERFSNPAAVVREMDTDPLISQRNASARTARTALDGIRRVWAAPERLVVPLLALHGQDDLITAAAGSRELVARAGAADKTLRVYPGFPHDLFHEPNSSLVSGELRAWLDAHTGGPAVPFASTPLTTALRGESAGRALSVELDVRADAPSSSELDGGISAGLRSRVGVGPSARLSYYGGLDLRAGAQDGFRYEAAGHVLGVATRSRSTLLALSGGLSLGNLRDGAALSAPVELSFEASVGPTRLLARAAASWALTGDGYADSALGIADEVSAFAGLRLFSDHHYWSATAAGAGPYVALTYRNLGGEPFYGVALGAQLWGGN